MLPMLLAFIFGAVIGAVATLIMGYGKSQTSALIGSLTVAVILQLVIGLALSAADLITEDSTDIILRLVAGSVGVILALAVMNRVRS